MKVFDRFARNRDFDELICGLSSMFCSGKPVSEKALEEVLERILADIPDPWPCFEFLVALDSRAASTNVLFRRRGTMPPVGIRLAFLARSPVPKSFLDVTPCDFLFLVHALNLPTTFSTPWDVVLDDGDGKSSNISKSIRRMESFWSPEGVNAVGDFETMPPERYLGAPVSFARVEIPPSKRSDGDVATYFQAVFPFECEDFLVFLGGVESTAFGGYFLRALEIDCTEAMKGYMTRNARSVAERWLEGRP